MFDAKSRYASQDTATVVDAAGRTRTYVVLREVPKATKPITGDTVHVVTDADRLDRIAWKHLGDPQLYWRLCDANRALHPDDLIQQAGDRIDVPKGPRS